jgi:hypothetical protein
MNMLIRFNPFKQGVSLCDPGRSREDSYDWHRFNPLSKAFLFVTAPPETRVAQGLYDHFPTIAFF